MSRSLLTLLFLSLASFGSISALRADDDHLEEGLIDNAIVESDNGADVSAREEITDSGIPPAAAEQLKELMSRVMRAELAPFHKRLVSLEAKQKRFTIVSTQSSPKCQEDSSDENEQSGSDDDDTLVRDKPDCKGPYCQTALIPTKRVYTTWITVQRKVTITKKTPYLAPSKEWDAINCCWRTVYVTKYKDEDHEIVVPEKKQVIQEAVGHEEIKVCLDNV